MKALKTFPVRDFKLFMLCLLAVAELKAAAPSHAQIPVLEENFESKDFSGTNGSSGWSGDTSDFTFISENNRILLKLQAAPDPFYTQIRTPLSAVFGSWEFWFRQDFTASNFNRSFFFLLSDRPDLNYLDESRLNGYAIRAGENGEPKKIRLIRFDNGNQQEILASRTSLEAGRDFRVKVTRSIEGVWQLHVSEGYNSTPRPDSGTITDLVHTEPGYFGLLLRYTSLNTSGFYFDDFRIIPDFPPLSADSVEAVNPSTLDIRFNRTPDTDSLSPEKFQLGEGPLPVRSERLDQHIVRLHYSEPLDGGFDLLTITGVQDLNGIETDPASPVGVWIIFPPEPGDLVINEILFDPIQETDSQPRGQSEYIEISNRQDYAISLEGIHLRDLPSLSDAVNRVEPASDRNTRFWIPGNGIVLLYPELDQTEFRASRTAQFFELPADAGAFAIRFDRSTLSLPLGGRTVVLSDSSERVLDMVDYQPEWHNPNLIDTRGVSLERVSPDLPSDDPANWGSSTHILGGSPGEINTLFQNSTSSPENTGLSLKPNPFSPDGDGRDDHLMIHYRVEESDYMLRVRIYDRYGRHVRTLADSRPAGFEGILAWDGRNDGGNFVRIGIYILFFEASHSMNGQNLVFREVVVAARQF